MTKILFCKQKKERVDGREHIVIKEQKYMVRDLEKDFQTTYGIIPKEELKKPTGTKVKTKRGKEFVILDAGFTDEYADMKRLPQTIPLKDIGLILAETGVNKNSVCVDAGLGSGALTISLANVCKKVTSYEIREDYLKQAQKNIERIGLKNVTVTQKDITEGIQEKNLDLVTLDMPEPSKVVEHAAKALKIGGFLVCYAINVPQVEKFVQTVRENEHLQFIKTTELLERTWQIEGNRVRPSTISIGHSGFLTFVRKILK